jgi:hypothetical protein
MALDRQMYSCARRWFETSGGQRGSQLDESIALLTHFRLTAERFT